ncbi:MAG: PPA1309 family protein [Acidothermaceae bacterium]
MNSMDVDGHPRQPTALEFALAEVDQHLAAGGWDQPARLYALVKTADLVESEPELANGLGLSGSEDGAGANADALTPVEQESLPDDEPLDEWLAGIGWPAEVLGCVLAQEVLTLPPSVEADVPTGPDADPVQWAATHPLRHEVRMLVGVLRDGSRWSILRIRGKADADDDLVKGNELVPLLADALAATLAD